MFHFAPTTSRFQLLSSPHTAGIGVGFVKTTELALSNADANSATAVIQVGKMVDYKDNDETLMKYGMGNAIGILTRPVSLNGTTDDAGFKKLTLGGFYDIPVKRGLPVSIFKPFPGCEAIFEGAGNTAGNMIDHLVISAGTGALAAGTAIGSELSVTNGAWRIAQVGDWVLAKLLQANYTPVNATEVRIRLSFVAPYKKSA